MAWVYLALAGLFGARFVFGGGPQKGDALKARFSGAHQWLTAKYYVDELYEAAIGRPLVWLSDRVFLRLSDRVLLDGTLNGLAGLGRFTGGLFSRVQSGRLHRYAWFVLVGLGGALYWSWRHV